ncbi:MAG: hypothetical protein EOM40_07935 [Clostridia bacterium]|nr:hypothetical protein [Clostridia bacterium]
MNFFDIKRLLARNQHVFRFTKQCFNLAKQTVTYPDRKKKAYRKLQEIEQAHASEAKVIWYCCVAIHPNLGDLAQTVCTLDWLRKNYPDTSIVEISSRDYYFNKRKMISIMKNAVTQNDLIVFQSGYTMTGVHENESMRQTILDAFPNNRIILLPQTIFYQTEEQKNWAVNTYKNRENLLLLVRDRVSFNTAKELFGTTQMVLYPDIVTTLIGMNKFQIQREGILFCVRDDWERLYSEKEMSNLMFQLKKHTIIHKTDTTVHISNTEDREAVRLFIKKTLEEYAHYKLVVTDRYHGTIFALAAGTPVLILKTTDHKVITGAEWFEPCMSDYISVAENLEMAETLALEMMTRPVEYKGVSFFQEKYYDRLKALIEEVKV